MTASLDSEAKVRIRALDAVGGIALQHATPYAKMRRVTPVA